MVIDRLISLVADVDMEGIDMLMSIADVRIPVRVAPNGLSIHAAGGVPGACETAPGAKVAAWGY